METSTLLPLIASTTLASAQDYSPFFISDLTSHQPNGSPGGNVNFYTLTFNVRSSNGEGNSSAYCNIFWPDNGYRNLEAYSVNVPTEEWIQCDSSPRDRGDKASDLSFQLFPYFSIGNYTLEVRQTLPNPSGGPQTLLTAQTHITNTTTSYPYPCAINPQQVPTSQVHVSGTCSLPPSNQLVLPVHPHTTGPCTAPGDPIPIAFAVQKRTQNWEAVFVVGSSVTLGEWNPGKAVLLGNEGYKETWPLWNGTVRLRAGERVRFKYLVWSEGEGFVWECCEERVLLVPQKVCGAVRAGNRPADFFRGQ